MEVSPDSIIKIHGRESLHLPYSRWSEEDGSTTQLDISGSTLFFEVPAANIRKQLTSDSNDPLGLVITLTREEVETLPTNETQFAVVDETTDDPAVEWRGKIVRTGYTL